MQRIIMLPIAAGLCATTALADVHDFPSADSEVVASVGFIDGERVGFFWTQSRGDGVTEFLPDSAGEVTRAVFDFDVLNNGLRETLVWALLINGEEVASFEVPPGLSGPQQIDVSFAAIASSGGGYEVSFECRNDISGGAGSHTLRYAGAGPHQIELIGEACRVDLDGDGSLTIFDFLAYQNL
ncbi:MAG: hypothetical protein ACIAQU_01980, partial [Phycisphaerales bacterium JB064]